MWWPYELVSGVLLRARGIGCAQTVSESAICGKARVSAEGVAKDHKMPESLSAFCRIVSLTAAKTSRMFDVSVACVRLVSWSIQSLPLPRDTD